MCFFYISISIKSGINAYDDKLLQTSDCKPEKKLLHLLNI